MNNLVRMSRPQPCFWKNEELQIDEVLVRTLFFLSLLFVNV